jgi:hypothetical protein
LADSLIVCLLLLLVKLPARVLQAECSPALATQPQALLVLKECRNSICRYGDAQSCLHAPFVITVTRAGRGFQPRSAWSRASPFWATASTANLRLPLLLPSCTPCCHFDANTELHKVRHLNSTREAIQDGFHTDLCRHQRRQLTRDAAPVPKWWLRKRRQRSPRAACRRKQRRLEKKRKHSEETSMNCSEDIVKDYEARAAEVRQAAKPSRVMIYHCFPLLRPH